MPTNSALPQLPFVPDVFTDLFINSASLYIFSSAQNDTLMSFVNKDELEIPLPPESPCFNLFDDLLEYL